MVPASGFFGQTPLSFTIGPDGKQIVAASFDNVSSWYESRHQASNLEVRPVRPVRQATRSPTISTLDAMAGSAKDDADRTEIRFYYRSIAASVFLRLHGQPVRTGHQLSAVTIPAIRPTTWTA